MSDLRCPRCGDSFRIPSVDLPAGAPAADLSARCPWCAEIIPLAQLLTALPPLAQLIGHDGQPLAMTASGGEGEGIGKNPFALQSAGLSAAASAVDAGALTEEALTGEGAFTGAEGFTGESFDFDAADAGERDADSELYGGDDQDADADERYGDLAGGGSDFADAGFEADEVADEFEVAEHAGPVDPRPIEEVSEAGFTPEGQMVTPRARAKKKSSSLRSVLGVVAGGLLALPLAAGILALLGKPLDLGFWPFDGQTIATGGSARTAAPMLPLSDEARPARPPQQGRSLAEDVPGGELMTMDLGDESGLPGDEQPAATGPEKPWEFRQSTGRPSMAGPEMVVPQVAEEAEPEAAVADADAAAFDPFAAEPFAAEPFAAEPFAAEPFAAEPFAPLEQPFEPLDPAPAEADLPASAANDFSLDDPLLTLPAEPAAAAETGDEPATEPPTTEAPPPLAPAEDVATGQPNAEEDVAVTPTEPADNEAAMALTEPLSPEPLSPEPAPAGDEPTPAATAPAPADDAAPEDDVTAETAQQSQQSASPDVQSTEAAAPERPASSPEFAAAQTAAESALQAVRDYDLAAGVAGLKPHLANLYSQVAALGELAEPQDAPALALLTEQMLEINVLKDLAPAAPNWAKYSRRSNDGMLAIGPLRQEADAWLIDWGGPIPLEIRFRQGDAEVQPQAKVLVLGRIVSSEPSAPAIEATFLQSLD